MPYPLGSGDFSLYPPEGREVAISHLAALKQIPATVLPVFLVDLKQYDWEFPAEQREIVTRIQFVEDNPTSLAAFRGISTPASLATSGNIRDPQRFLADVTAYLWSSLQTDAYRRAADQFEQLYEAKVKPPIPAQPRLVMICIGREAAKPAYPLFQKLRNYGEIWTNVRTDGAAEALLAALARRSESDATPYAHWYVDGGSPLADPVHAGVTQLLYPALAPVNKQILGIMMSCIGAGSGPEVLHDRLAELTRENSSARRITSDDRLQQFVVSLLTQGSGTQIFSTSFVQWATREILRRAQPSTILARYAPRQRQKPFNTMVAEAVSTNDLDPDGSLVEPTWAPSTRVSN